MVLFERAAEGWIEHRSPGGAELEIDDDRLRPVGGRRHRPGVRIIPDGAGDPVLIVDPSARSASPLTVDGERIVARLAIVTDRTVLRLGESLLVVCKLGDPPVQAPGVCSLCRDETECLACASCRALLCPMCRPGEDGLCLTCDGLFAAAPAAPWRPETLFAAGSPGEDGP